MFPIKVTTLTGAAIIDPNDRLIVGPNFSSASFATWAESARKAGG